MDQYGRRREPPLIDIDINGRFPPPPGSPLPARIIGAAIVIAVIAGGIALVALVLWLLIWALVITVPIALAAAVIAWGAWRYQLWRARHSFGGPRNPWSGFLRR